MISALAWVPRGAAKPVLDEAEPTKDDLDVLAVSFPIKALRLAGLLSDGNKSVCPGRNPALWSRTRRMA